MSKPVAIYSLNTVGRSLEVLAEIIGKQEARIIFVGRTAQGVMPAGQNQALQIGGIFVAFIEEQSGKFRGKGEVVARRKQQSAPLAALQTLNVRVRADGHPGLAQFLPGD